MTTEHDIAAKYQALKQRLLSFLRQVNLLINRVLDNLPPVTRLPVKILGGSLLVFLLLIVTRPETAIFEPKEKIWPVYTYPVFFRDARPVIPAYGQIVAAREIDLRALVSGEVIHVSPKLEAGIRVQKGDMLLQIDPFEYENALAEAEAELLGAEASHATAKTNFERAEKLFAKGTVAKQYLENQRADYLVKKAGYERLKTIVRRARRNLDNTKVVAPFDAYVSRVNVREGRLINSNDFVAHLSDAQAFELRFNLSDADYGAILAVGSELIGRPVRAVWQIGERDIYLQAKVQRVGALVNQATRGVDIYAEVLDTDKVMLRSGAFVSVLLELDKIANIVVLPSAALFDGDIVYAVHQQRLEPRKVDVLMKMGGQIYITAGIENGEQILISRFNEVAPGLLVEASPYNV